jgi:hypothetical protein
MPRAHGGILKVAGTIADLEDAESFQCSPSAGCRGDTALHFGIAHSGRDSLGREQGNGDPEVVGDSYNVPAP